MYKMLLNLLGNSIMKKLKLWLSENGFMGFVALAVAGGAAIFGMWFLFWAAIGGFVGKNWEIIRNLPIVMEYKDKIADKIDDII